MPGEEYGEMEEASMQAGHMTPWDPPTSSGRSVQAQGTLWQRYRFAPRRAQIGIVGVFVVSIVLCALLSAAVIGSAFHAPSHTGGTTSTAGQRTASPTKRATLTPTLPPGSTTPTATLPLTFTCADGAIGETGHVCVHTQPNAVLTITIQYCDGSTAGGKSLQAVAHADASGNHTWRWAVKTSCVGQAKATVTAKSAGRSVTKSTTFTVTT